MSGLILIVDDEEDLAATLEYNFSRDGYQTRVAHTGLDALKLAALEPVPDLIVLDLMLPDLSGTEVCRRLRADDATRNIAVLMLTARTDEIDLVVGFEIGADDYMTKPFSVRELLLRVRAVLRRAGSARREEPTKTVVLGVLRLDLDAHQVWVDDEELALTALEFKLLTVLMSRKGRVQTRDRLLSDVWGIDADITTRTVDTHVKRLRKKLGPASDYLETLRGVGYRFPNPSRFDVKLGFRGKLFGISLLLIAVGIAVTGLYLEHTLRTRLEERTEADLLARAHGAAVLLETMPREQIDTTADRLARGYGARVTVIAADGRVIGDSERDGASLAALDNHAGRPEVVAAVESSDHGVSYRYSITLDTELVYVAVPLGGDGAVVRVAMPLVEVDEAIGQLRWLLLVGGLLGLGAAVLLTMLASHLMARELTTLVNEVRQTSGVPADDERDEVASLAGSFHRLQKDLSGAVTALASERDRLEAVLEGMSEGLLALDVDLRITLANPAATAQLQLAEDSLGRPLLEAVRVPALYDLVRRGLAEPATTELELSTTSRIVLATATPLRGGSGCVVVMHDLTEIRRLETIRKDFVANVSHELRTPVSVIRANAETLLQGALDDETSARRFTTAILSNAERLSRLIADLLDLSRLESGRMDLQVGAVAVAVVVRRALDAVQPAQEVRAQQLETTLDPDLQVSANADALEQVLINLLDNAISYTPEGGRIEICARADGTSRVRVEVRDDGPGIAPAHRARVFERFYRVDTGRARRMGGTGLGLAIVKHLVEGMGGEIGVEPAEPQGAVFWLSLPST